MPASMARGLRMLSAPLTVEEQCGVRFGVGPGGRFGVDPEVQVFAQDRVGGDFPVVPALAGADDDPSLACRERYVLAVKGDHLADAGSGVEGEVAQGAVAGVEASFAGT